MRLAAERLTVSPRSALHRRPCAEALSLLLDQALSTVDDTGSSVAHVV